jgi:cell division transport system permease protein
MWSRVGYAFREMWASFQRNVTLTAAAVVTSAVSLLLVGSTFLIQRGFENLLARWQGDVQMIVFVRAGAPPDQIGFIEGALRQQSAVIDVSQLRYLDQAQSYAEAQRVFAGDPTTLSLLRPELIPSQFKVVPLTEQAALVRSLAQDFRSLPGVEAVALAEDEFEIIAKLSGFVRTVTITMSLVLLVVAVGLIWNTIRTAMFARRREIEVMKLVGATNWFIRVPFMLEGLLQGLVGGALASGGLWGLNRAWSSGVAGFKPGTGISALVVPDGYLYGVMGLLLAVGMIAGAIGSAIAASRFLDV